MPELLSPLGWTSQLVVSARCQEVYTTQRGSAQVGLSTYVASVMEYLTAEIHEFTNMQIAPT